LEDPPRVREIREDIPEALDNLVGRMLAKAPENRPPDGEAVAAELAALAPLVADAPAVGPPSGNRQGEITDIERRIMCLVLTRSAVDADATRAEASSRIQTSELGAIAERHHGKLELIDARTPLVVLSGALAPTD